jgi:glycosyltransferase involved in cell wall biosynthesis
MGTTCRRVLQRAYGLLGRALPDGWCTDREIAAEREQMLLCDFVTAPNDAAHLSLLESGIAPERILDTSYGFSPIRLAKARDAMRPERDPVFAFVGLGNVRKGLPMLLQAWARAGIRGSLLLAGRIDDDVRSLCKEQLALPNVHELGYVSDIARVYAQADVFVFPSHEEGGPQVIYEAAACGLPSIVSPMGAGRVVRGGREGLVVDPLDVESIAQAIRVLGRDRGLRESLGEAAAERAKAFSWRLVGQRLHDLLLAAVGGAGAQERRLDFDGEVTP